MRRPAPPSIEEERKIKPFAKKPITFMFHATYGNQLLSIVENGLRSGKSQSNPSGRTHVHMACIDDVILDDNESEAALTHVPARRDALLILAFLKDQDMAGLAKAEEWGTASKVAKAFQSRCTEANVVSSLRSKVACKGFRPTRLSPRTCLPAGALPPLASNSRVWFYQPAFAGAHACSEAQQAPSTRAAWTFRTTLSVH